jgi:hypothetical protein
VVNLQSDQGTAFKTVERQNTLLEVGKEICVDLTIQSKISNLKWRYVFGRECP